MKMIVTDLDGTILRDDKTISQKTKQIFAQCRQRGIKVVYATGRGISSLECAPAELFDGCIQMNGAIAVIENKLIYNRTFSIDCVRDLLVESTARGMKVAIEIGDKHYSNFNVTEFWSVINNYEIADFKTFQAEAEKVYFVINNSSDREFINGFITNDLFLYVDGGIAFVSHYEAIKSKAIHALASYWGIHPRDIVSFGDGENDIDMIKSCGVGVAMGNASEEVKSVSDFQCDTNENDGAAKWIEDKILQYM